MRLQIPLTITLYCYGFSLDINLASKVKDNCDLFNSNPLWKRASDNNIQEYTYTFDKF